MPNETVDMETISTALGQINSGNEQEVYKGTLAIRRAVAAAGTPGQESAQAELNKALAAALGDTGKYSARARCVIAEQLGDSGGDDVVPALEGAMGDLEVRGAARWALDRIPTDASTAALVKAANESVGSRFRTGLMNSLGQRSGAEVVATLMRWAAEDPVVEVRLAAAESLANHSDKGGYAVLMKLIEESLSAQDKGRIWKAAIRLANNVAAAGDTKAAGRMFRAIADGNGPEPQKKAAAAAVESLG